MSIWLFFPGPKRSYKIGYTKLNGILFHSMTNGCNRKAYVQGFDFEAVTFNQAINMFDHMK